MRRALSAINHLGQREGEVLTRRPYVVSSFAAELSMYVAECLGYHKSSCLPSCLSLWHDDRSLIKALDQAKSLLMLLDVLNMIWPCSCAFLSLCLPKLATQTWNRAKELV